MTIQHLRSSTANKRPTPAAMSDGQLAVNTNTASPGLFFKDSAGALIKVGPVHVGTTAPNASPAGGGETGNTVGEQWLDTAGGTYVFKVWDGSAWRSESGTFVDVNGDVMTGALGIIAGSAGSPGLYFSGDTNTGLYSPGADQVAISTGGSGRLFVDASGRVGLGASSPQSLLHIDGDATAFRISRGSAIGFLYNTGTTATDAFRLQSNGGSVDLLSPAGQPITFSAGGSEKVRITSAGLVGVGTSSPQGLFSLTSPGTSTQLTIQTVAGANDIIKFDTYNASAVKGVYAWYQQNSEVMRLDASGRLGVGITSVNATRQVEILQPSGYTSGLRIRSDGSGAYNEYFSGVSNWTIGSPHNTNALVFGDGTERLRIDSSGRLLVGTSSALGAAKLETLGNSFVSSAILARINSNDTNPTGFVCAKDRAGAIVQSGDQLGAFVFRGYDGSNHLDAAFVRGEVDGTPGANDMPGRLVFSTTADGASSPTERMRLTSTGQLRLASAGITFNGDTAQANELDDYEEGTWTPAISFNGSAVGVTYSVQDGHYIKIGNLVTLSFRVGISNKGSSTGALRIEGAPFSPGTPAKRATALLGETFGTVATPVWVRTESSSSFMLVFKANTSGFASVTNSDFTTFDTFGVVTFQI